MSGPPLVVRHLTDDADRERCARRLYARLGYTVIGEFTDCWMRGASEILLRKTLGPLHEFRKKTRDGEAP